MRLFASTSSRYSRAGRQLFAALCVSTCWLSISGEQTQAALLTGTINTSPSQTIDLTAIGLSDWAYWGDTGNPAASGAPTNSKFGPGLIGNASLIGAGSLRGSTTLPQGIYSFTDGTSPTSSAGAGVSGIFNSTLNTAGRGVSLVIDLPTLENYTVYLWVSGFAATGNMSAQLPGATTYTDSGAIFTSPKTLALYTFNVSPDTAGDDLTLNYTAQSTGGSGHVLFAAAAVAVPEPSTIAILSCGMLLGIGVLLRKHRPS